MKHHLSCLKGDTIKAIVLVCLAVGVVGMSYGSLAMAYGFPLWVPFVLSLTVLAGASEFMFIGIVASGGNPLAAAAAGLLVNARHVPFGVTVRELVAIGRYPWHGALGRFGVADREKVEEAIALVGLKPLAHRLVDSLSGGERQRAWIAMLVAQDSRCLLLDEPTSALDIAHQVDVLALVHRLSQQRGLMVIAVLHDINMAARYCDYLVALRGGEMIAQGTPAELMRSETLEHIYGIPMGILPHPAGAAPVSFVY